MSAQIPAPPVSRAKVALAAALPFLALGLAYLASVAISASVVRVGWFDRAWFGWTVVVPLLLAAPGLAGMASFVIGNAPLAKGVIWVVSLFVAIFTTYRLGVTLHQIGCQVLTDQLQAVPVAVTVGLAAGIAFAVAASGAA